MIYHQCQISQHRPGDGDSRTLRRIDGVFRLKKIPISTVHFWKRLHIRKLKQCKKRLFRKGNKLLSEKNFNLKTFAKHALLGLCFLFFFRLLKFQGTKLFVERLLTLMISFLQMQNIKIILLLTSDKRKPKQLSKNKEVKQPGLSFLTCVDRP